MGELEQPVFARALDAAITDRGVTLSYLHRRLAELATPVSVATLSYWRSGRSEPERQTSLAAVDVLEEVLGLEPGALATRLAPVRRPKPPGSEVPIEELTGHPDAVRAALRQLDFDTTHDELAEDAMALSLDLDEQGRAYRMSALLRWRALVPGAQRVPLVVTLDRTDEGAPVVEPRAGLSVGRSHVDLEHGLHVTELVLERPLDKGEAGFGEYEVRLQGRPRQNDVLAYYATRRVSQALVWARFHPDAVPRRFEAFDVLDGEETTGPMDLRGANSLHRRTASYGPGTLGIRWWW